MNHRMALAAWLGVAALAGLGPANTQTLSDESDHTAICHHGANASVQPFYAEVAAANARMHDAMNVAVEGDVDRDFARMMIPHHQGAIDMARAFLKYGHDERLRRLAQSILVEQDQEITYMRKLLDEPAPANSATRSNVQP